MLNWIFVGLDGTLIVTPKWSRLLFLKSKLWKDLSKPYNFLIGINYGSVFCISGIKRKTLLFLTIPSERSRTQTENITCSIFFIIRMTSPIWISETKQDRSTLCIVMNPKLNGTQNKSKYFFCCFQVTLMGWFRGKWKWHKFWLHTGIYNGCV